ncbi:hypothetical protein OIPHN330_55390 (plasmid) [Citrobacter freundii]|jgi:hypothetical protein|nr:hypothetical protein OIPHN330_55390 [Citrobacter freundii]BEJ42876.1 hypothetical protein OIPHN354_55880 [Citrobacter freundii]
MKSFPDDLINEGLIHMFKTDKLDRLNFNYFTSSRTSGYLADNPIWYDAYNKQIRRV